MKAIAAVLYREGKIRFTNSLWIFWDLLYPLGYLLVFGVNELRDGIAVCRRSSRLQRVFSCQRPGDGVLRHRVQLGLGILRRPRQWIFYEMLTYPLSRAEFLIGKVAFNLLLGIMQAVITVAAGRFSMSRCAPTSRRSSSWASWAGRRAGSSSMPSSP